MQSRFCTFTTAFKGSVLWTQATFSAQKLSNTVLYAGRRKYGFFFTRPIRAFSQSSRRIAKTPETERQYPSRLLIYESGDLRLTWVSFWKSVALLQFGTTVVFVAPMLWNNPNQPNSNLRKFQAFVVGLLAITPTAIIAYLSAPFVHKIFLQIPEYARRSRKDLMHFARTLRVDQNGTANTKLEFETLRVFPSRKTTATFLHELHALPPRPLRMSNIELVKTEAWEKEQREKSISRKILELMNEPRFKFYVKPGRLYTMKTKVPGVWEQVAERILEQTMAKESTQETPRGTRSVTVLGKPVRIALTGNEGDVIKRQTWRPSQK